MKVALVVTGGFHPSGTEQVIPMLVTLADRLGRHHDVHVFSVRHLPSPTTYRLGHATVHDLGRPAGRWAQGRALLAALREHGPFDVIHGYWIDPGGVLAAMAGRRLGIPSVVTCDSGEFVALPEIDYGVQRTLRGRTVVRLACTLATRLHVVTPFMAALAAAHGYSPITVPFGLDLPARRHPDRPDGPPWRLLNVGSLNPVKDHSTLLRALVFVRQQIDVRLDVVGDDALSGRVQSEAADLGLGTAVAFHGFVRNDDLERFHRAAHVYIQSSRHEAAGIAVLEAAASGLPIVGTRVGFVHDWAPEAALGVPPNDPEALAAAIVELLSDPAERRRLSVAAYARATTYDVDWTAGELTRLYESVAQTSASGASDSEQTQR